MWTASNFSFSLFSSSTPPLALWDKVLETNQILCFPVYVLTDQIDAGFGSLALDINSFKLFFLLIFLLLPSPRPLGWGIRDQPNCVTNLVCCDRSDSRWIRWHHSWCRQPHIPLSPHLPPPPSEDQAFRTNKILCLSACYDRSDIVAGLGGLGNIGINQILSLSVCCDRSDCSLIIDGLAISVTASNFSFSPFLPPPPHLWDEVLGTNKILWLSVCSTDYSWPIVLSPHLPPPHPPPPRPLGTRY